MSVQGLLCWKRFVAQVAGVNGIGLQCFPTRFTMFVQVKLFGCCVATQGTNMFCEFGIGWFLFMYSFLVGPQVTVCRRIVSALDPNRFDVTLESFLFVMWYLNFVLLLKDLSHKLQGDSIFVWTSRLWSLRRVSLENAYHKSCTQVQNSFF